MKRVRVEGAERRRFLTEMRKLRQAAKLNQTEAAELIDRDQRAISSLERGERGIRKRELWALLDGYGVTDDAEREELWRLSQAKSDRGWLDEYASSLSPSYASYVAFEQEATEIHTWEPALVHGLLQTPDYARGVIRRTAREATPDDVERRVEVRIARQAHVEKARPRLWMVMSELSLRLSVGSDEVMREQLSRLLEISEQPQITIQVVPLAAGVHPGVLGSLTVLRFPPPDEDLIYLETMAGDVYPAGNAARDCKVAFDHVRACALDVRTSIGVIRQALSDLKEGP
ncbi:MAG: helix-turn-helix domain-containing protein [Micromonosporaceae bacterium]